MFNPFKDSPSKTAPPKPPRQRHLIVSDKYKIPVASYESSGIRSAVLAQSGMGKSYLVGVLMEQLLQCNIPLCVIDPEGETFTLTEKFPSVMIIGGDNGKFPYNEEMVDQQICLLLEKGVSLIWDTSHLTGDDERNACATILGSLLSRGKSVKRPCIVVIEEAQTFAPQAGGNEYKACRDACIILAKRGRKYGIGSIWATQRPASVSKDVLTQCVDFWFGGIKADQDYKAIKSALDKANVSYDQIRALTKGMFFHFNGTACTPVSVGKRLCSHGAVTPSLLTSLPMMDVSVALGEKPAPVIHKPPRKKKKPVTLKKKTFIDKLFLKLKGL